MHCYESLCEYASVHVHTARAAAALPPRPVARPSGRRQPHLLSTVHTRFGFTHYSAPSSENAERGKMGRRDLVSKKTDEKKREETREISLILLCLWAI